MHPDFWNQKWARRELGFHEPDGNALLKAWFSKLSLARGARVLVPLCGKTRDIGWLLSQGMAVVGVELNEGAVRELFDELGVQPEVREVGAVKHFSAPFLDVFVGDFFAVDRGVLGDVDAIYDCAALVALPAAVRDQYTQRLVALTDGAPQLVICFEYDQQEMQGPPFSIDAAELERHYGAHYTCRELEHVKAALPGTKATERVWLLSSR